jgi:hypothetical protein
VGGGRAGGAGRVGRKMAGPAVGLVGFLSSSFFFFFFKSISNQFFQPFSNQIFSIF